MPPEDQSLRGSAANTSEQAPSLEEDSVLFCNIGKIDGFRDLFRLAAGEEVESIKFGSTLLLSGPPGAGKTTFALATVRAMMANAYRKAAAGSEKTKTIAYYISSEVYSEHLMANFKEFGWFLGRNDVNAEHQEETDEPFKFWIDHPEPDRTNFYCITPMFEVDRPVPSPEELVNGIFNSILHTLIPSESPAETAKIYIIIDSITALLKGCESIGEERRQTHEIMRRFQDRFGKESLALIILLAEQDHRSQDIGAASVPTMPTAPSVEDYLADIVFRLYVRSLPLGRRSRVLEIVKSQGANMALGEHTWNILSKQTLSFLIRDEAVRKRVRERCSETRNDTDFEKEPWGGIIIFPRPRLYYDPPRSSTTDDTNAPEAGATGTEGLDLDVGARSITLIAGPMGCGKTTLCKQFLEHKATGLNQRVLISFDIPTRPAGRDKFLPLHFTQSQFDLNVLIAHINWILDTGCDRLAFDGLSEWMSVFDKAEAARVMEAIMVTVQRPRSNDRVPPAVFMTYEIPLDEDPLGPAALGARADNLVVVRKVPINDELRKIIYVLKSGGDWSATDDRQDAGGETRKERPTHRHPGELRWIDKKLMVNYTSLEAFTGLLNASRKVEPARVLIQLFAENKPEESFNERLARQIESQFAQRIALTFTRFSLSEIGNTLETAFGAGNPGESFNLAIHAVDEWWLKAQKTRTYLLDLGTPATLTGPNSHDFWWFEIEKALGQSTGQGRTPLHAVPNYLDFGMFCIDLDSISDDKQEILEIGRGVSSAATPADQRAVWRRLLHKTPRLWASEEGPQWFKFNKTDHFASVLDFGLWCTDQTGRENLKRKAIFSFDTSSRETCTCMFLELAWAFGARESFLAPRRNESARATADRAAAEKALRFLQFMVMEGLLPARCSTQSRNQAGQPILFSRHWYSTLRKTQQAGDERAAHRLVDVRRPLGGLMALPFMPTGLAEAKKSVESLLEDIEVRQFFWLQRAERFIRTQSKSGANQSANEQAITESLNSIRLKLYSEDQGESSQPNQDDLMKRLKDTLKSYHRSRKWLLDVVKNPPLVGNDDANALNSWVPDLDDLIELAAWTAFRLRLLFGASEGKFPERSVRGEPNRVAKALYEARWVRHSLPDLQHLKVKDCMSEHVATGYVCSGSWFLGVDRKSRSSEIQARVLTELTSLERAEERAEAGAGMPARKDFFYLRGEVPVTGMKYLHWRELLRFGGARARRRDRVLIDPTEDSPYSRPQKALQDPSELYSTIHREVLACLRIADLYRQQYATNAESKNATERQNAIDAVSEKAKRAVEAIYAAATE